MSLSTRNTAALVVSTWFSLGIIGASGQAAQLNATWIGGTGVWSDDLNWSPNDAPNNDATNTYNVLIDDGAGGASAVTLDMNATIDKLTIDPAESLTFQNPFDLKVRAGATSGTIDNGGTIVLDATTSHTELLLNNGIVTLTGGGVLTLNDNSVFNRVRGSGTGPGLINVNNTIQGAGQVGVNSLFIDNRSVIVANATNTLTVDPNTAGMVNTGTLRAASGATLILGGATYTNVGGVIEALNDSFVQLSGTTIAGGTLQTFGTGLIQTLAAETLDGSTDTVTIAGTIEIQNANDLNLRGTISNTGTISLNSTTTTTELRVDGGEVTLTGGGVVNMGDVTAFNSINGISSGSLTNVNNTIQGAGSIGANTMSIENQSLIVANATNALTIDPNAGGMLNTGTLRADSGATLVLQSGTFTNSGAVIEALDLSTVSMSTAVIIGGTLRSVGSGVFQTTGTEVLDGTGETVTIDGTIDVRDGDDLNLRGTITNLGTISLNSTGSTTELHADNGVVLLTGGGVVNMGDVTAFNSINGLNGGSLTNVDNTIQGAGAIGANNMSIENQSLIIANATNPLTIDPNVGGMLNTGTLRAQNGATMVLQDGTFTNTGSVIEALSGSVVRMSSATIIGGTLRTAGGGVFQTTGTEVLDGTGETVTIDGIIDVRNNHNLNLRGTITNLGTISLNSTTALTELHADGGEVILIGGGMVSMGDVTAYNSINGYSGGSLTNVDNIIYGAGRIGDNNMTVDNRSLIIANATNTLTLDPSSVFTNTGTLRAENNATMVLTGGTFANTGGVIEARDGSVVRLSSAVIDGGTLQTTGTGLFQTTATEILDGTVNNVTNAGLFNVLNADDLVLRGTINNTGTINLKSTDNTTELKADTGVVMLTGGGTIVLDDANAHNRITGLSGGSLINVNNTIRGAGIIGANVMSMTNQGSVIANGTNALTINPPAAGSFTNEGVLQATGAGGLVILAGPFTSSGTVSVAAGSSLSRTGDYTQTAGSTMVEGTLSATGVVNLQGGVLGGDGTVDADVTNAGATVSPGSSAGDLQIDGDFTQTDAGTLRIELGGELSGEYDVLSVLGTANLDGKLDIVPIDSFRLQIGQQFVVLNAASVFGTFNAVHCADPYIVTYSDDRVTVTITAIEGDATGDGDVDLDDNVVFFDCMAGPGTTPDPTLPLTPQQCLCTFDFDADDDVDLIDFARFQQVFLVP